MTATQFLVHRSGMTNALSDLKTTPVNTGNGLAMGQQLMVAGREPAKLTRRFCDVAAHLR
jgi:hypothetical protein